LSKYSAVSGTSANYMAFIAWKTITSHSIPKVEISNMDLRAVE
jgi:hypothetical protein